MCGVSLRDRIHSEDLRYWVGVEPIGEVCRRNRLRWFGHVERKEDDDWVKRYTRMEVVGKRPRSRPRKTWMSTLKDDMKQVTTCYALHSRSLPRAMTYINIY
jgi:hypothetical protein